jgi:hypothetical protein
VIGYLDIETSFAQEVTLVGLMRSRGPLIQIVGSAITREALESALKGLVQR